MTKATAKALAAQDVKARSHVRAHQERVRRALALLEACEAIEKADDFEISTSNADEGAIVATADVGEHECAVNMASIAGAIIGLGAQVRAAQR